MIKNVTHVDTSSFALKTIKMKSIDIKDDNYTDDKKCDTR